MKPLEGLLVADLSRILAGPYCTMTLGDLGARVLKIEEPEHGDDTRAWGPPFWNGESAYFLAVNRNKESVTLDLERPEARGVLWRLVSRADVLVENFRPGTFASWGFGDAALLAANPRLVVCSISGYGRRGPEGDRPGYDLIAQGEGGVMSLTGEPGRAPMKAGVSQADIVAGMWAANGILAALLSRARTGRGQRVETSLLEGQLGLLAYHATNYWASGEPPQRLGNRHPNLVPYACYRAADGWLTAGVGSAPLWRRFCDAVAAPELADHPEFARPEDRVENRDALERILADRFATKTVAEWRERFDAVGVPSGPVRDLPDVMAWPQVHALGAIQSLPHPRIPDFRVIGLPVRLSETPGSASSPPPLLGEHTERVLDELGYDDGARRALAACGATAATATAAR